MELANNSLVLGSEPKDIEQEEVFDDDIGDGIEYGFVNGMPGLSGLGTYRLSSSELADNNGLEDNNHLIRKTRNPFRRQRKKISLVNGTGQR